MKVTKMVAEKERLLTMAETEAYAQFEASDRAGHVVLHPQVAPGKPAPDAVAFLKDFTRLVITYVPDRYRVQGDQWFRLEDDGEETPIDDTPLEVGWHAAMAVKSRIEQGRDRGAWVVRVRYSSIWSRTTASERRRPNPVPGCCSDSAITSRPWYPCSESGTCNTRSPGGTSPRG